jgi:hypothetical protein
MQAAEVKIIEAMQGAPSILGDAPRNLALPALGGAIVRYTSKGKHELIGQMVDGSTETPGWRSKDGYLPQDVVFAFRGDHSALIDRIVLNPATKYDSSTRPQLVTVAVSDLLTQGMQVRLDIVGFALAEEAVKQEMERIAALTGGRFFDARDAAGLRSAIEQALAVPYEVHDAAGEKVGGGPTGQGAIAVPEGLYSVVVSAAGTPLTVPDVRVVHNELTRVELKKEGQEIGTQVVQAAPEEAAVAVAASSPTAAGVGNTPTAPGVSVAKVDTTPAAAKSSTAPEPAPAQQQTKCAKPSEPVPAQQAKRSEPAAHKKENVPLGLRKDVLFVGREEHGSE